MILENGLIEQEILAITSLNCDNEIYHYQRAINLTKSIQSNIANLILYQDQITFLLISKKTTNKIQCRKQKKIRNKCLCILGICQILSGVYYLSWQNHYMNIEKESLSGISRYQKFYL